MRAVVLIGQGELPRAVAVALERAGADVRHLETPTDGEIAEALDQDVTAMVVVRSDVEALRLALVIQHTRPGADLIVTIFDRTVADQLRGAVPSCRVTSMAAVAALTLAGPAVDERYVALTPEGDGFAGVHAGDSGVRLEPLGPTGRPLARRVRDSVRSALWPFDLSARFLVAGLGSFFAILVIDAVVTALALHESPAVAFYQAAKVLVTVGPNPEVEHAAPALKVFAASIMIASVVSVAVLTAGVVNRLLDPRLTALVGPRAVPRDDHVIVVGLGQVGLRLCETLKRIGVGVVAVETNADAAGVRLARAYRIPVVIGSGTDPSLLRQLHLGRARALAAITSDDVENIAISLAALSARDDVRVILRAGDGDVTRETRSLFHIGVVRDAHGLTGDFLAAMALGIEARGAAPHHDETWLVLPDGGVEPFSSCLDSR